MGDFNESVIFDAIRREPDGLSRVELASATKLSAQTVSNICRRLLDRGMIHEAGKKSGQGGKRRTLLQVNPAGGYAIGVHLDPAVITYVMLDLLSNVVHRMRRPTPQAVDQEETLAEMSSAVDTLIERSAVDRGRILGVGIAVPGPVEVGSGSVVEPPLLSGWHRVPLRDYLSEKTRLPVLMDKDVIAAAIAERWAGAAAHSGNFLFFYLGTGSGMGAVVDDVVLRGVSNNAGEVGGLDANCTTQALVNEAIERGVLGPDAAPADPREAERSLQRLVALADEGDETAAEIIDGWARRVAHGVCAAATLLDSELIVFGGPIWPHLSRRFLAVVEPFVAGSPFVEKMHDTAVTSTAIGDDVGAIGAACLVLDQILSAQVKSLLIA
ncbi:ROK family transcriptional regulator [Streptomyces hainanensis]|uniref:ROK family transcriptional regulator n=2 Tax=Streptomyces hainanensis TaxID=402648 RepID=A0A4R4SST2_9ACTN|nr:ROK family transcriptional regulator [Streptomyces hainanensis]